MIMVMMTTTTTTTTTTTMSTTWCRFAWRWCINNHARDNCNDLLLSSLASEPALQCKEEIHKSIDRSMRSYGCATRCHRRRWQCRWRWRWRWRRTDLLDEALLLFFFFFFFFFLTVSSKSSKFHFGNSKPKTWNLQVSMFQPHTKKIGNWKLELEICRNLDICERSEWIWRTEHWPSSRAIMMMMTVMMTMMMLKRRWAYHVIQPQHVAWMF